MDLPIRRWTSKDTHSARSIAAHFKNQQTCITADTVLGYLSHICDAFLLFRTSRFEIKGNRHLEFL
ncbi:MAG: hypothetical protein EXR76_07520 [Myxococcales bacterium]|nr:hypothetical protein [Myxococcales bacterium]